MMMMMEMGALPRAGRRMWQLVMLLMTAAALMHGRRRAHRAARRGPGGSFGHIGSVSPGRSYWRGSVTPCAAKFATRSRSGGS